MPVNYSEFSKLSKNYPYAEFIHTNLHMHTPATPVDWDSYPDQTDKAEDIDPQRYFDALNQTTLDLVAVTDHNCVNWCEPLIDLAKNARENGTSKLHILPGVEITTYEGPHLVAIFDELFPVEEIRQLLTRLKLSGKGLPTDRVDKEITITKIIQEVDEMGGIIIGPHIHTSDGLWGSKEFRGRTDVLNDERLRILAAPSKRIKQVTDKPPFHRFLFASMDSELISNSFAFINVSDCHRLDDFELNTTWIKMCQPSIEGVRQIIYEPELRVSNKIINSGKKVEYPLALEFIAPSEPAHAFIIGISISGGMLDGEVLKLSPHQNCVIGKNYAGKSAILDCIRFALNIFPVDELAKFKFTNRLKAIVSEGGEVRLYVKKADGKIYGIDRTLSLTNVGNKNRPKWEVEGRSNISYLIDDVFHKDSSGHLSEIFDAEIYAQGDVVKIKDNVSSQMSIVNSLAKINNNVERLYKEKVDGKLTLFGELAKNSQKIIDLQSEIADIENKLHDIPDLEEEIENLEAIAGSNLFEELEQWTELEIKTEQLQHKSDEIKNQILGINNLPEIDDDKKKDDQQEQLSDLSNLAPNDLLEALELRHQNTQQKVKSILNESIELLGTEFDHLTEIKSTISSKVSDAQSEISTKSKHTNIEELTQRITDKKRKLSALNESNERKNNLTSDLTTSESLRNELLDKYYLEWEDIRRARKDIVSMINSDSADNIEAELIEDNDFVIYQKLLREIAEGLSSSTNKISNYSHIDLITTAITPKKLKEIVIGSDANKLVEAVKGGCEKSCVNGLS
jgi:hypothetical protein